MADCVKERLTEYLEYEGISKSEFGRAIGVSNAYVTSIRKSIDSEKIKSIALNYPNLNIKWLLTGIGNMITTSFSDRISEIVSDLSNAYASSDEISKSFGITFSELTQLTHDNRFPSTPFDLAKFLSEFPEYRFEWIISGEGEKFDSEEEECLRKIKERIYKQNHPEYFPENTKQEEDPLLINDHDSMFWAQIRFQNEQLKEKDAQIREKDAQIKEKDAQFKQLLDFLQKK